MESRYDNPLNIQFMDNTLSNDHCWPVTTSCQGFGQLVGEREHNRPEPNNGGINGFNTTNQRLCLPHLPVENSSHPPQSFREHLLKSTTNPSTNFAFLAEPPSTLETNTPSSLPTSHHKSHPPAGLESQFRQERLDYLGKHVDLDNTTNSALLSFARGLGYKQSLNNVQREEFSALRERQEREMIVKAIELGVHPDSVPHYSIIRLPRQFRNLKSARNEAFKMEPSSDNASSFVNTLLMESCIRTKGMTHGLSILNYMAAYIQSPHTLPSRIGRSEAVNKREPVYHLRKHEDQLHSLDDCQYRDEKETYAKKLLKQLASDLRFVTFVYKCNALQQDFKEWPVAKFDKIFKGWSFYCEKSDVLSAEDFVNHMQAGLRRAHENWLKVLIEQLEQGNVVLQEKPGHSRKKQRLEG
ncbi:hypothetical protein BT69DRAFT_1321294 [Atractiella rhizophila]|nr:hypothetical protein BT69DRAFT_1321294 [Atractiella rhizophila]